MRQMIVGLAVFMAVSATHAEELECPIPSKRADLYKMSIRTKEDAISQTSKLTDIRGCEDEEEKEEIPKITSYLEKQERHFRRQTSSETEAEQKLAEKTKDFETLDSLVRRRSESLKIALVYSSAVSDLNSRQSVYTLQNILSLGTKKSSSSK